MNKEELEVLEMGIGFVRGSDCSEKTKFEFLRNVTYLCCKEDYDRIVKHIKFDPISFRIETAHDGSIDLETLILLFENFVGFMKNTFVASIFQRISDEKQYDFHSAIMGLTNDQFISVDFRVSLISLMLENSQNDKNVFEVL